MLFIRSPFRLSLFGGSSDYKSFYEKNGSLLIGSTIDKYSYLTVRERPSILPRENHLLYSKYENVKSTSDIENPLIREIFKHSKLDCCVDFHHFTDIPHRTGLGGSSTFAVGLLYLIKKLKGEPIDKKELAKEAIHIEREILGEAGGIQDQIWASFGNLSSIEIKTNGDFKVKPLPITQEFKNEFEHSLILIYTNEQRQNNDVAKSHDNKDKTHIKEIAYAAHGAFLSESIKSIGNLLYESWLSKIGISSLITNDTINTIINDVMTMGAYGCKSLGAGGGGFCLVIADPITKFKIIEKYQDSVLDIKFENDGVKEIYRD